MRRRTTAALLGILAASACGAPTCSRGACDRAAVVALAAELDALDTRAQEVTLRARLPELCALPPGLRRSFDDWEGRSQPLRSRAAIAELDAAFAVLCPDIERISTEVGALASRERAARIYDDCDLARLGIADRDDMLRNDYGQSFWVTYQWLLDQGIAPEVARALAPGLRATHRRFIATIEDHAPLELPAVDAPLTARPVGVRVELSTTAAVIDGRTIATIADGRITDGVEAHRVFGLDERLAEAVERQRQRAAGDLAATPEPVRIAADRRVRFAALVDVIFTAARRGVRDFALEVEVDAFDRAALPFELPPAAAARAALWVAVADDGAIALRSPERRSFTDPADLARWVEERCADGPSSAPAVLEPASSVDVGAITRLLVTLRGEACGDAPGPGCCFPRVAFAAPRE
ncbi:MAG: hypothetical protein R3A79_28815 [Nannocystaceae bacterium]